MGEEKLSFNKLLELLPEGWGASFPVGNAAKELKALQRAGKIKPPEELLRLLFLYLTRGKSFAGTAAITQIAGECKLNKMAVWKRVRNSAAWLEWLSKNICRKAGLLVEKPAWLAGKTVSLVDVPIQSGKDFQGYTVSARLRYTHMVTVTFARHHNGKKAET
jgi:hypothetical protein